MHQLCRIDLSRGKALYRELDVGLQALAQQLRTRYRASKILVFGSSVRQDLNEGSDIDLLIVNEFTERFHKRITAVLELTELPIEPLCYTEAEFEQLVRANNSFIAAVLEEAVEL
jgi:predicted nucleotidyltransferase